VIVPERRDGPEWDDHAFAARHGHGRHGGQDRLVHYDGAPCTSACPTAGELMRYMGTDLDVPSYGLLLEGRVPGGAPFGEL
jgi:hypothetical protein